MDSPLNQGASIRSRLGGLSAYVGKPGRNDPQWSVGRKGKSP